MFWEPDPRTPEQYQSELDEYIELATKMLPFFLLRRACEHKLGRVSLTVSNGSDDPISQLQVELVIAEKASWASVTMTPISLTSNCRRGQRCSARRVEVRLAV